MLVQFDQMELHLLGKSCDLLPIWLFLSFSDIIQFGEIHQRISRLYPSFLFDHDPINNRHNLQINSYFFEFKINLPLFLLNLNSIDSLTSAPTKKRKYFRIYKPKTLLIFLASFSVRNPHIPL